MANQNLLSFAQAMGNEVNQIGKMLGSVYSQGVPQAGPTQAPPQAPQQPQSPQGGNGLAGSPLEPYAEQFAAIEKANGLPAGYLAHTAGLESTYGRKLQNPKSSASGPFQFIDSTAAQYGLSDDARMDPLASAQGAGRLGADNAGPLRKLLGREPTVGELYLAHQQGAGGASKLLRNPDARAVDVVGREEVLKNGGNENMTAQQFANLWINKKPGDASKGGAGPDRSATISTKSPNRGELSDEQRQQIEELEDEEEDLDDSPEARKRRKRGAMIAAIGKGLGQISQGETVDISSVFDQYHRRQEAMRDRIAEINKSKRDIYNRVEERGWSVDDREDLQAHDVEIQEIENEAAMDRQVAGQVWQTTENMLSRDLDRELQEGRIDADTATQLRGQQWDAGQALLDRDLDRELQENNITADMHQLLTGQQFQARQNTLNRDLDRELQDGTISNQQYMQAKDQQWSTGQALLDRDLDRELQEGRISAAEKQQLDQQKFQAAENVLDRDLSTDLQEGRIDADEESQLRNQQWQTAENLLSRDLDRELQEGRISASEHEQLQDQKFRAREAMQDRDLDRELQEGRITADEKQQLEAQRHDVVMQQGDQDFQTQYQKRSQDFTTTEREASQGFLQGRDERGYEHDFSILNDEQKYQSKADALDKAFAAGQAQKEMDFSADQADEARAHELGMAGDTREFQLGMENLRNQHIVARDETLEGYSARARQEERNDRNALRLEQGEAMSAALPHILGEDDPELLAAAQGAVERSPERGMELVEGMRARQLEEGQKSRKAAVVEQFAQGSDLAATLAADGDYTNAIAAYKKDNPDAPTSVIEQQMFSAMSPQEKADYATAQAAKAGTLDPARKKAIELEGARLSTASENLVGLQAQRQQLEMLQSILDNNPDFSSGAAQSALFPLKKLAGSLGLADTEGMDQQEIFNSVAQRMVPMMRQVGSGSTSDFDAKMFTEAAAGLGKSPSANRALVHAMSKAIDISEAKYNAEADFLMQGGGTAEERNSFVEQTLEAQGLGGPIFEKVETSGYDAAIDAMESGQLNPNEPFYMPDSKGKMQFHYLDDKQQLRDQRGRIVK